jgi:hypothetical protein
LERSKPAGFPAKTQLLHAPCNTTLLWLRRRLEVHRKGSVTPVQNGFHGQEKHASEGRARNPRLASSRPLPVSPGPPLDPAAAFTHRRRRISPRPPSDPVVASSTVDAAPRLASTHSLPVSEPRPPPSLAQIQPTPSPTGKYAYIHITKAICLCASK